MTATEILRRCRTRGVTKLRDVTEVVLDGTGVDELTIRRTAVALATALKAARYAKAELGLNGLLRLSEPR